VLPNSAAIPLPTPEIPLPTSSFDINQPIDIEDNFAVKGALFASEKAFSAADRIGILADQSMTICGGISRFSAHLVANEIGD
jgi:hypothetical protein